MKTCNCCRTSKPRIAFSRNRAMKDGLQSRCRECWAEMHRTAVAEDPDYWLKRNVKNRYGLSWPAYQAMVAESAGRCDSCADEFGGHPFVDHCHTTGRVRGLLCHHCNVSLGHLRDDPVRIAALMAYLDRPEITT